MQGASRTRDSAFPPRPQPPLLKRRGRGRGDHEPAVARNSGAALSAADGPASVAEAETEGPGGGCRLGRSVRRRRGRRWDRRRLRGGPSPRVGRPLQRRSASAAAVHLQYRLPHRNPFFATGAVVIEVHPHRWHLPVRRQPFPHRRTRSPAAIEGCSAHSQLVRRSHRRRGGSVSSDTPEQGDCADRAEREAGSTATAPVRDDFFHGQLGLPFGWGWVEFPPVRSPDPSRQRAVL